jgi:truncated hemoglobin YjbI
MSNTKLTEPILPENYTGSDLGQAYNWYSENTNKKTTLKYLNDYLKKRNLKKEIPTNITTEVAGKLARLIDRGQVTDDKNIQWMVDWVNRLADKVSKPRVVDPNKKVVSIQDAVKNKLNSYLSGLDHAIDDFIHNSNYTLKFDTTKYLKASSVKYSYLVSMEKWVQGVANEFILSRTDPDFKEGYSNYTESEKNKVLKFLEGMINSINTYAAIVKPVRVQKAKAPIKLVSGLKYQRVFLNLKTKLTSVSSTELIGAREVWVYNTTTRMLGYYTSTYGDITVSGTTLKGFDKAEQKILRKPDDILPIMLNARKGQWIKTFEKNVKTVALKGTGRFNDRTIILKVFK